MRFLSAEWRNLIMANYAVDPALLRPHVPKGVELDLFEGVCYASLVGFMFADTRVLGLRIPRHTNFEEVNLRFYVRRHTEEGWRRGVVFVKEIVPRAAITLVARSLYREPYQTMPMRHRWDIGPIQKIVEYEWKCAGKWNRFTVEAEPQAVEMPAGSEPEFITEHYYGYTRWNEQRTMEYGVTHPRWLVNSVRSWDIDVDFGALYGQKFAFLNAETPRSVLLAEGSAIEVLTNNTI